MCSGTADQPGPRRDGRTRRPSASLSGTLEEEVSTAAEGSWDPAEVEGDRPAEGFLGLLAGPRLVSGVDIEAAEEAGNSPILNSG